MTPTLDSDYFDPPVELAHGDFIAGSGTVSDGFVEVKAQMSGIFYRTPDPESAPFVEVGVPVLKGQILGLLEAMKVFSKVKAPVAGTLVEIRAQHEATVTAGQVLFRIARP